MENDGMKATMRYRAHFIRYVHRGTTATSTTSDSFVVLSCALYRRIVICYSIPILLSLRPPLWSRGNFVTSHPAGPGSIPGRVNFHVDFFPGLFINPKTFVPAYHMAYHMVIIQGKSILGYHSKSKNLPFIRSDK